MCNGMQTGPRQICGDRGGQPRKGRPGALTPPPPPPPLPRARTRPPGATRRTARSAAGGCRHSSHSRSSLPPTPPGSGRTRRDGGSGGPPPRGRPTKRGGRRGPGAGVTRGLAGWPAPSLARSLALSLSRGSDAVRGPGGPSVLCLRRRGQSWHVSGSNWGRGRAAAGLEALKPLGDGQGPPPRPRKPAPPPKNKGRSCARVANQRTGVRQPRDLVMIGGSGENTGTYRAQVRRQEPRRP